MKVGACCANCCCNTYRDCAVILLPLARNLVVADGLLYFETFLPSTDAITATAKPSPLHHDNCNVVTGSISLRVRCCAATKMQSYYSHFSLLALLLLLSLPVDWCFLHFFLFSWCHHRCQVAASQDATTPLNRKTIATCVTVADLRLIVNLLLTIFRLCCCRRFHRSALSPCCHRWLIVASKCFLLLLVKLLAARQQLLQRCGPLCCFISPNGIVRWERRYCAATMLFFLHCLCCLLVQSLSLSLPSDCRLFIFLFSECHHLMRNADHWDMMLSLSLILISLSSRCFCPRRLFLAVFFISPSSHRYCRPCLLSSASSRRHLGAIDIIKPLLPPSFSSWT